MPAPHEPHAPHEPRFRETPRVAVVASGYHAQIVDALVRGAREAYESEGGEPDDLRVIPAPGAFELPLLARAAASRRDVDAVVALGCIVKGETRHDEFIAHAVANELIRTAGDAGKPVAFGVITAETLDQARARAGLAPAPPTSPPTSPPSKPLVINKGAEAMRAAVLAWRAVETIRRGAILSGSPA